MRKENKKTEKEIQILSFTKQGSRINRLIGKRLRENGYDCACYTVERFADSENNLQDENAEEVQTKSDVQLLPLPPKEIRSEWIGSHWGKSSFVFIGAAGIAIRLIAPWVKDKFTDSPVIVMDEQANYVIPLLSGHVGGAVELARKIALCVDAEAVVTTATDVERLFAVDVFAAENQLYIESREVAKQISAALLEGKTVGFYSEFPWTGSLPKELFLCKTEVELEQFVKENGWGIWVASEKKENMEQILQLLPKNLIVGIGCRRGIADTVLREGVREILKEYGYEMEQICKIASIDLKKEEPAILALAEELCVPFLYYTAEELKKTGDVVNSSEFVKSVTGVDNVCERAAKACEPNGNPALGKTIRNGMTAAAVQREVILKFGR